MKPVDRSQRPRITKPLIHVAVWLLMALCFNVLNCRQALAASASAINQSASQALTGLYQDTPGALALAQKSKGILVSPGKYREGGLYRCRSSTAMGFCVFTDGRPGIIDRSRPRLDTRRALNRLDTSYSLWTTRRSDILTEPTVGSLVPGQVWSF